MDKEKKKILEKAIEILETNNKIRHKLMAETNNENEKEKHCKEINANNAMILDYKYRIQYE